jgi:hypothetical protein
MKKELLLLCLVGVISVRLTGGMMVPLLSAPSVTYRIIPAPGNTFCYDIYSNGRRLIHQTSIPGLPGNKGFRRRRDAKKVAALVVIKLQNNILPPTVSRQEMDSLNIKYP